MTSMTKSKVDIEKLKEKITLCKWKLIKEFPFFGILALKFKYLVDEEIPTAGTNGSKIIFNPEFLEQLSLPELKWLIAHEIMHVSNGHIRRRDSRNATVFNLACDYAIHDILKQFENSDFRMPSGKNEGLYDPKYAKMSAEEIYDILLKQFISQQSSSSSCGQGQGRGQSSKSGKSSQNQQNQNDQQDQDGNGKSKLEKLTEKLLDDHGMWDKDKGQGDDKDSKDGKDKNKGQGQQCISGEGMEEVKMSQQEWEQLMISAAKQHQDKSCGNLPAFLQELLIKLKPPKKDWRQLLNEFVSPIVNDYSFNPPDKRLYSITDCMLPDFNDTENEVKNILFFIDISGSMSDKEIEDVYSEVVGAIQQFASMTGWLGYFDTAVHSLQKFEDVQDVLQNKPRSGGGTCFRVCFEAIHKRDDFRTEDIAGIVILTDGECYYDNCEELSEGIPTLWIMTQNSMSPAPFGQSVYLNDGKKN